VLSDVFGLSGQPMLDKLLTGNASVEEIADLAQKSTRKEVPQIRAPLESAGKKSGRRRSAEIHGFDRP